MPDILNSRDAISSASAASSTSRPAPTCARKPSFGIPLLAGLPDDRPQPAKALHAKQIRAMPMPDRAAFDSRYGLRRPSPTIQHRVSISCASHPVRRMIRQAESLWCGFQHARSVSALCRDPRSRETSALPLSHAMPPRLWRPVLAASIVITGENSGR